MVEIWLIVVFFLGLGAGWCAHIVVKWWVKREAISYMAKQKQVLGTEKKQVIKSDKVALALELKDALQGEGDLKSKLPKMATALTNHPDASEELLKQVTRFL